MPPLGAFPDEEIKPNCHLDVHFEIGRKECRFPYKVPECVENKCDCSTHQPTPSITNLEQISEDEFLVHWDPGTIQASKSHNINSIFFS